MNTPISDYGKSDRQSFPCPVCGFIMELSTSTLLYGNDRVCPACGITLSIDRTASRDALANLIQLRIPVEDPEPGKKE